MDGQRLPVVSLDGQQLTNHSDIRLSANLLGGYLIHQLEMDTNDTKNKERYLLECSVDGFIVDDVGQRLGKDDAIALDQFAQHGQRLLSHFPLWPEEEQSQALEGDGREEGLQ